MKHWLARSLFGLAFITLVSGSFFGSFPAEAQTRSDPAVLQLLNRMKQLEQEVRQLRGEMEVFRFRQEDLERQLQTATGEGSATDFSTQTDPSINSAPSSTYSAPSEVATLPVTSTSPPVTDSPRNQAPVESQRPDYRTVMATPPPQQPTYSAPAQPPTVDERAAYNAAFNRLREGRYSQAISGFKSFLTTNPNSSLAGNAQYWLGEAYYVSRDFSSAEDAFIALGINYPNSDRVPDALLKLGYIYDEMGDKTKARNVLQKLLDTYPNSQSARLASARLSALR
ncbi:MAG: tol-pal system protein YbgF [Candidatus Competibacteraceae bacterium]|nr:tol-pal system protein YbgF [Candidatus Competibacteraceae bacterium]